MQRQVLFSKFNYTDEFVLYPSELENLSYLEQLDVDPRRAWPKVISQEASWKMSEFAWYSDQFIKGVIKDF